MKKMDSLIDSSINDLKLESEFKQKLDDARFLKLVKSIDAPNTELMKWTSKLCETCKQLENCSKCSSILECRNEIEGYVYYPNVISGMITFGYNPCKYMKESIKNNAYKDNIFLLDIPQEIKNAMMKNIDTTDKKRHNVIKMLKEYYDNYKKGIKGKGLYLYGNFGSGKTYLISAMLNEIAKDNKGVAIVYFPELLVNLKNNFGDEDYSKLFNHIKRIDYLLIDDIGAEVTSAWGRDEVLGTILQYRMQESLPTFFTSNLNIKELEEHLSISNKSVDNVKARRIIERIEYLTNCVEMISENKRK